MNEKDQRIYKVLDINGRLYLFDGDRLVNNDVPNMLGSLAKCILCDYFNASVSKVHDSHPYVFGNFRNMLFCVVYKRRHLIDYGICGLSIKECINERERPENI